MKKIALISDARTSHGIYVPILKAIESDPDFEYIYILTGMHLSEKFGNTLKTVKNEGFDTIEMPISLEGNKRVDQAEFIGKCIINLIKVFQKHKPDILLVQGDRGISLAAAIVGAHMWLPVAHLHGGEVSGTIDELTRHAITKYSHIHFPASKKSAERILKMGEDAWRIFPVGSTSNEYLQNTKLMSKKEVSEHFGFNPNEDLIVVLQHPVTKEVTQARKQMEEIMNAIEKFKKQTIIIYPNSDAGSDSIIKVINERVEKNKKSFFIHAYKNIAYDKYLSLLKNASVLVGNSSGGIIETPILGLPAINIGTRQDGREKADNIIDTSYKEEDIIKAITLALNDKEFRSIVAEKKTPYLPEGDSHVSKKILEIIKSLVIDDKLLDKKINY
jgi:UDP-N-acetylglucosamine 2-epimerase (non-hydrolysing)/GDP/UDP-N,N'-diacetylbacillosamine 2-epimerase (hydrolysing)